mgnify:FL=1
MGKFNIDEIKKNAIEIIEPYFSYIDGKYLRNFRMKLQLSQSIFADYLGVSKKAIEKWEQGKNKINAAVVRLVYLIEKEPKNFSLLKEIKICNEYYTFDLKKYEFGQEYDLKNNECYTINHLNKDSNWHIDDKNIGGNFNVSTSIWFFGI